jgi:hypothetical protein
MKTSKAIKILTIVSSSLAALLGGLATLPIPSSDLPMPESWRPYLVSVAFIAAGVRIVVIPVLDNIAAKLKEP